MSDISIQFIINRLFFMRKHRSICHQGLDQRCRAVRRAELCEACLSTRHHTTKVSRSFIRAIK